jgi:hypothetical protein
MLTLLIIFIAIAASGFGFWFYNKKQITNLSEQIDDKNAIINALQGHVETVVEVESSFARTNSNNEWRGNTTVNLTPTVEEALGLKEKKNKNKFHKKDGNKKTPRSPQPSTFEQSNEKKNRPKPRKKNKPTE